MHGIIAQQLSVLMLIGARIGKDDVQIHYNLDITDLRYGRSKQFFNPTPAIKEQENQEPSNRSIHRFPNTNALNQNPSRSMQRGAAAVLREACSILEDSSKHFCDVLFVCDFNTFSSDSCADTCTPVLIPTLLQAPQISEVRQDLFDCFPAPHTSVCFQFFLYTFT